MASVGDVSLYPACWGDTDCGHISEERGEEYRCFQAGLRPAQDDSYTDLLFYLHLFSLVASCLPLQLSDIQTTISPAH